MARLLMAEMDRVRVSDAILMCEHCREDYTAGPTLTLADVIQATTDHKAVCPNWPTPRSRTAQRRVTAGQMTIPLPE